MTEDLIAAVRHYVACKEMPGVSSEHAYHAMRHACRRAEQNTGAVDASRDGMGPSLLPLAIHGDVRGHSTASVAQPAGFLSLSPAGGARHGRSASPTDPGGSAKASAGAFSGRGHE